MKTYTVTVYENVWGYLSIEAESEEQAEQIALQKVSDEGLANIKDFNYKDREYDVTEVEGGE